ncbi:hypothetical protein LCGC14_2299440 [marine sediment metagenome]|uniref:Uncharacterized protein n=1 Tax=marine sediment metagenome TaxID=412755 RepID=A0A0F9CPD7_9ZZZZ
MPEPMGFSLEEAPCAQQFDYADCTLAFLTGKGAVLKTDEGHVGILIHRLSDDSEVPMTAFAPLWAPPDKP